MAIIETYLTDRVDLVTVSVDEWGSSTKTIEANVKARIENENRLVLDQNGQEVMGHGPIFIHPDYDIKYETRIRIKKRNGVSIDTPDKEYAIKRLDLAHGFQKSHWEAWV